MSLQDAKLKQMTTHVEDLEHVAPDLGSTPNISTNLFIYSSLNFYAAAWLYDMRDQAAFQGSIVTPVLHGLEAREVGTA